MPEDGISMSSRTGGSTAKSSGEWGEVLSKDGAAASARAAASRQSARAAAGAEKADAATPRAKIKVGCRISESSSKGGGSSFTRGINIAGRSISCFTGETCGGTSTGFFGVTSGETSGGAGTDFFGVTNSVRRPPPRTRTKFSELKGIVQPDFQDFIIQKILAGKISIF